MAKSDLDVTFVAYECAKQLEGILQECALYDKCSVEEYDADPSWQTYSAAVVMDRDFDKVREQIRSVSINMACAWHPPGPQVFAKMPQNGLIGFSDAFNDHVCVRASIDGKGLWQLSITCRPRKPAPLIGVPAPIPLAHVKGKRRIET